MGETVERKRSRQAESSQTNTYDKKNNTKKNVEKKREQDQKKPKQQNCRSCSGPIWYLNHKCPTPASTCDNC